MTALLHDLLIETAERTPEKTALIHRRTQLSYAALSSLASGLASCLCSIDLPRQGRVAIYLPKRSEGVAAIFGTTLSGGAFVPINPLLKSEQVTHILTDCNVYILITSIDRLNHLTDKLVSCKALKHVIVLDADESIAENLGHIKLSRWESAVIPGSPPNTHSVIDQDMASIFYTSGSTGKPKGVVLSHRNMVTGAKRVAQYLGANADDRLLAALPLSFDYGFSQLSIAFYTGATVALMDYLFPKDVMKALQEHQITGLAGVPPLWMQLTKLDWPEAVTSRLRYITNSGGAMPSKTLAQLRALSPDTQIFLMYGLTESFRSTYLDPAEIDKRPDSIGKAIPNTEVMVINEDGQQCAPGEPGELVHRGELVSLGYWGDPEKTSARFRPIPGQDSGITIPELAVWSGDTVTMDEEGFLYFVGRRDEMIKTSGYRVSPTEVEEAVYDSGQVAEAIATGVPSAALGQAIVVVVVPLPGLVPDEKALLALLRQRLPNFMVPEKIVWRESLPRNPNGKIDRKSVHAELIDSLNGSEI